MAAQITQCDYDILVSCETLLRDGLEAVLDAVNAELNDLFPSPPVMVLVAPQAAQLAARSDGDIAAQDGGMPQAINGVWCRITGEDELTGWGGTPGNGAARTRYRLEVLSYATVQVQERSSAVPTTLTTGYKYITLLSRAAAKTISDGLVGTAGVYSMARVPGGSLLPEPIDGMPHVHQRISYFDVYQCTLR